MMKFTSLCLISALWILLARTTPGEASADQEALISCMKIKRQAPYLNLKCEELLKRHEGLEALEDNEAMLLSSAPIAIKTGNLRHEDIDADEADGIRELSLSEMKNTKKVSLD